MYDNQVTKKVPQYIAGLAAAGGALATGAALGWPSPAGPRLVDGDDRYFPITESEFAWVSSIITVGCAISCLPIGYLMNKFGRKWTMISLVVPFLIGWGLVIWAQNYVMLLTGRFFVGLAGGAFCITSPQYAGEIAENEIRGIIGTFLQLLINVGILLAYVAGAFVEVFWLSVICGVIPIIFALIFFFMPESPVYLVTERRTPDAVLAYKWLRGDAYNPQEEIDELNKELEESNANQTSFWENVKKKATLRAMAIAFGVMFFQQMCGINVVVFSVTFIFQAAETDLDEDYQTIIVGAVLLFSTLIGSFLVDRLGRKILMLLSSFFMGVMLTALGTYFWLLDNEPEAAADLSWLPITALSLFLISYSLGYGPLPWLIMSEVYSMEVKSILSPITGAFCWLLAFVVTVTFGYIRDAIGMGATFWLFAGLTFLGIPFAIFVLIETKARTRTEIQRLLAGEKLF